jgi:hypothetical protein
MGGGGGGSWSTLGDIRGLEQKAREALKEGKRNVFISFATEDMDEVNLLRAHAKNENSDVKFNDHSVREPYDSERGDYIWQKIGERIARASVTVVYLSENTAQSRWVEWEVEKSIELGKRVVAVHPNDHPGGPMPEWVQRLGVSVVPWSKLADELK